MNERWQQMIRRTGSTCPSSMPWQWCNSRLFPYTGQNEKAETSLKSIRASMTDEAFMRFIGAISGTKTVQ